MRLFAIVVERRCKSSAWRGFTKPEDGLIIRKMPIKKKNEAGRMTVDYGLAILDAFERLRILMWFLDAQLLLEVI